jgi:hypothetical protein
MSHEKNKIFTFFAFSTVIFFVIGLVTSTKISVGIGFGLFAMFSVLRYRTDTIPIRDMTYLFIIMTVSVMNAVMFNNRLFIQLAVANLCIISITYLLEKGWGFSYEIKKNIKYEKIELIRPENQELFLKDLRERTGIKNIIRYEIGDIDFLKDSADIVIYFKENDSQTVIVENIPFVNRKDNDVPGTNPIVKERQFPSLLVQLIFISIIMLFMMTSACRPAYAKDKNRTEFYVETQIGYSDNIFKLTESQKSKFIENSADDTTRFEDMDSISELVYSPEIGLKYLLSDSLSGKLELTMSYKYNYFSKNDAASYPEASFKLKKEINKKDELQFKADFIFSRFKKNYMSGVNDINGNGNITRAERLYSKAEYDEYDLSLAYEHVFHKDKKSYIKKASIAPFAGYKKRDFNDTFINRNYSLPYSGVELKVDLQGGIEFEVQYEYGRLNSNADQELFLYDETINGVDVNSDGKIKGNSPVTSLIDRSSTRNTISLASSMELSDTTSFFAEYRHRTEKYTTDNVLDVKRYSGEGFEKEYKLGLELDLPRGWSSKIECCREHAKDSDGDESIEKTFLFSVKKKFN